jgi:hypothetical protein
MGWTVGESYYDRTPDTIQVIADIVEMSDGRAFLDASGHAARFPN